MEAVPVPAYKKISGGDQIAQIRQKYSIKPYDADHEEEELTDEFLTPWAIAAKIKREIGAAAREEYKKKQLQQAVELKKEQQETEKRIKKEKEDVLQSEKRMRKENAERLKRISGPVPKRWFETELESRPQATREETLEYESGEDSDSSTSTVIAAPFDSRFQAPQSSPIGSPAPSTDSSIKVISALTTEAINAQPPKSSLADTTASPKSSENTTSSDSAKPTIDQVTEKHPVLQELKVAAPLQEPKEESLKSPSKGFPTEHVLAMLEAATSQLSVIAEAKNGEAAPVMTGLPDLAKSATTGADPNHPVIVAFNQYITRTNEEIIRLRDEIMKTKPPGPDPEKVAKSMADKDTEINRLRVSLEAKEGAHSRELKVLEDELERQRERVRQAKAETGALQKENQFKELEKSLRVEIARQNATITQLQNKLKENQKPDFTSNPAEHAELLTARKTISQQLNEIKDLNEHVKVARNSFIDLAEKAQENKFKMAAAKGELKEKLKKAEGMLKLLQSGPKMAPTLTPEVSKLQEETSKLRTEIEKLEAKLLTTETQKNTLGKELETANETITKLEAMQLKTSGALHRRVLHSQVQDSAIQNLKADNQQLQRGTVAREKYAADGPGKAPSPDPSSLTPTTTSGSRIPSGLRPGAPTFHPSENLVRRLSDQGEKKD
ncbi:hypothetical protein ABW19_dt0209225 [Dactylella cylindrospora]|nr:hypothetical protein ABW19_dt0209225 [Dactylella cylindrospora]